MGAEIRLLSLALVAALCASACRDSKGDSSGGIKLVPSSLAANGCTGPDQTFVEQAVPAARQHLRIDVGEQHESAGSDLTCHADGEITGAARDVECLLASPQVRA